MAVKYSQWTEMDSVTSNISVVAHAGGVRHHSAVALFDALSGLFHRGSSTGPAETGLKKSMKKASSSTQ